MKSNEAEYQNTAHGCGLVIVYTIIIIAGISIGWIISNMFT